MNVMFYVNRFEMKYKWNRLFHDIWYFIALKNQIYVSWMNFFLQKI